MIKNFRTNVSVYRSQSFASQKVNHLNSNKKSFIMLHIYSYIGTLVSLLIYFFIVVYISILALHLVFLLN